MPTITGKAVEQATARGPQYGFAILIWVGVVVASVVAIIAAVA